MSYTDQELSAYLDGELPAETKAKIEGALQQDRALQARLAELKNADRMVRMAYGPVAEQPIPESVTALFPASVKDAGQHGLPPAHIISSAQRFASWPTAMAASVALVFGVVIGGELIPARDTGERAIQIAAQVTPGDPLFTVLEKTFSGDATTLNTASDLVATPVLSFALADGRHCREFVLSTSDDGMRGVACRNENAWETVLAVKSGQGTPLDSQYRTASAASEPLISIYIDNAMNGDAFGHEDEQKFIENGWALEENK